MSSSADTAKGTSASIPPSQTFQEAHQNGSSVGKLNPQAAQFVPGNGELIRYYEC